MYILEISELHPSYLPLQYSLLFPYGEDGRLDILIVIKTQPVEKKSITMREFVCIYNS